MEAKISHLVLLSLLLGRIHRGATSWPPQTQRSSKAGPLPAFPAIPLYSDSPSPQRSQFRVPWDEDLLKGELSLPLWILPFPLLVNCLLQNVKRPMAALMMLIFALLSQMEELCVVMDGKYLENDPCFVPLWDSGLAHTGLQQICVPCPLMGLQGNTLTCRAMRLSH